MKDKTMKDKTMTISIKGTDYCYAFKSSEVKFANKHIGKLILHFKNQVGKKISYRLYFTILVVMHTLSQAVIDEMDPDDLALVLNEMKK